MLNNLTNFFNLITTRKVKTTLDNKDLLAIGTPDARFGGGYQPTVITYADLAAQLGGGGLSLTTFGTSGASTLVGSTLNIPNYSTSSLPAWLEYDATDLTIWNNGKGNQQTNT